MNHNYANNFLMHYGKPGMKWGQRMAARNAEIKTARKKSDAKTIEMHRTHNISKLENKINPTSLASRQANLRANKAADAWLNDKNTAVAAKMTSGEIAASAVILAAGAILVRQITK